MTTRCPNCSAPIEGDSYPCPRCAYRPEIAGELLWLYGGGIALVALGFAFGALALWAEGAGPTHWTRVFDGWHPLGRWAPGYGWLGLLVVGVALTGIGVGVTRQKRPAAACLTLLGATELLAAGSALPGLSDRPHGPAAGVAILVLGAFLVALSWRLHRALRRAPRRDFSVRQEALPTPQSPP